MTGEEVFELRTYHVRPTALEPFADLANRAAKAAKKHADDVAKKVQDAGGPMADYFAGDEAVSVIRAGPFSEITAGDVPLAGGQYRFSAPEGIVAAGPEFLRAVTRLDDGSFLVSEWPGRLFHVAPGKESTTQTLIDTREQKTYFNDFLRVGDLLLVPNWEPSTLTAYRIR